MIPGARCKTCVYWVKRPANVYGMCYRMPPIPDVTEAEGEVAQRDVRPLVRAEEWCGEWRSKGEKPVELPPKGVRLV